MLKSGCAAVAAPRAAPNRLRACEIAGVSHRATKPAIVTSISRTRARQRRARWTAAEPDDGPTDDTLMQAMARMISATQSP